MYAFVDGQLALTCTCTSIHLLITSEWLLVPNVVVKVIGCDLVAEPTASDV